MTALICKSQVEVSKVLQLVGCTINSFVPYVSESIADFISYYFALTMQITFLDLLSVSSNYFPINYYWTGKI
jgi:hypothetical protein